MAKLEIKPIPQPEPPHEYVITLSKIEATKLFYIMGSISCDYASFTKDLYEQLHRALQIDTFKNNYITGKLTVKDEIWWSPKCES